MRTIVQRLIEILRELFEGGGERRWDVGGQLAASGTPGLLLEAVALDEGSDRAGGEVGTDLGERATEPFLLSVDDAGQYLVVSGERVSLGHLRAGVADLLFLAGIGPLHAYLERTESLSEGPVWSLVPVRGERSAVNEVEVLVATRLRPGDVVRLGENLAFRIQRPDPASHTALLELLSGAECAGAKHVVLMGAGPGGRLRIGAAANRHVRVANLEHEITLFVEGGRLFLQCESEVRGAEAGEGGFSLPLPPPQRFDLSVGKPAGSRPPFGLAIEPTDLARTRRGPR